ncbi:TPR end-of-group domain-containing protein [Thalassotalea marina]|uniref:Sel1 repeat family protein n=1 Tax=Thalassotalea marina TaxID=1673741 RepID=A0A919EL72_9GAMM|nr:hypothetical protein [Thalassotalea marina]GHF94488.1 hypothetical protein GCM10017161_23420 [Thalassotalea marina]
MSCSKYFFAIVLASLISFSAYANEQTCQQLADRFNKDNASPNSAYNMACCAALKGDIENAFSYLELSIEKGFKDHQWMIKDSDLTSLHQDSRWAELVQQATDAETLYLSKINVELYELYQADQSDRQSETIDWNIVGKRDEMRQARVHELLSANKLSHGDDFFHAAMVMQHGGSSKDYKLANELSLKAAELNPSNKTAKWLACAAEDRYLQSIGKPQIWGTQYKKQNKDAPWTLEPFDQTVKTDKQRVEMGVRTIKESLARVEQMNGKK